MISPLNFINNLPHPACNYWFEFSSIHTQLYTIMYYHSLISQGMLITGLIIQRACWSLSIWLHMTSEGMLITVFMTSHDISMYMYVFSLPISLVMIERIYILCLIIIIKSEVWTITHCLGLGHETMVSAVCLSIFLSEGMLITLLNNVSTWH